MKINKCYCCCQFNRCGVVNAYGQTGVCADPLAIDITTGIGKSCSSDAMVFK